MASASDVASQLPNPSTPMAFLPPELAWQVTVSTYVLVGSLSVCAIHDCLRGLFLTSPCCLGLDLGYLDQFAQRFQDVRPLPAYHFVSYIRCFTVINPLMASNLT